MKIFIHKLRHLLGGRRGVSQKMTLYDTEGVGVSDALKMDDLTYEHPIM